MAKNKRLIAVLGILISIGFLWVAFSRLNPQAVWEHIREAEVGLLLFAAAWYALPVAIISLRWRYMLRSIKLVPLWGLIQLVSIGYMGNNVYPFRSGEVLRAALLGRNYGIPFARTMTTAIVERVFDGIVMVTFVLLPLALVRVSSPEIQHVASITTPLFIGVLAVFLVLAARPNILRRLVTLLARPLPGRLRDLALRLSEEIIAGLEGLRTPADLAGVVVCSYISWMFEASVYYIVSLAFHLGISYVDTLLVVGVVNLAGLIPASPGQLGVYEFFVSLVLLAEGVADSQAKAYALVVHLVIWLPVTLAGFYFLAKQGLGFSAVAHAHELESVAE